MTKRTETLLEVLAIALVTFSLLTPTVAKSASVERYTVYDGDTFTKTTVDVFPGMAYKGSIRVRGIDAPEIHTRSVCEKRMGYESKRALQTFVAGRQIEVKNVKLGKYAGRVVGDVYVDGKSVADYMLRSGYARKYDGGKRNHNWCK